MLAILVTLIPNTTVLGNPTPVTQPWLIAAEAENSLETEVLAEINLARTNPTVYAESLEKLQPPPLEVINFLRSQSPLEPITLAPQLSSIAQRILKNPSGTTTFANATSEGDNPRAIALQLILEEGETIFQPDLESLGIACATDSDNLSTCVIAYNATISKPPEESQPEAVLPGKIILQEEGALADGDEIMPSDGSLYDLYPLEGVEGQSWVINLETEDFDAFLAIIDSENNIIDQNDDIDPENTNSRLIVILPQTGIYYIIVNSYDPQGRGNYRLTVEEGN
ncbi:hypothetical protein [Gloeocapsa sp. PCC 73106]|uniref:hypothetical protein n=1 Tax=Gloeocapsa sp. PCC 73106 TaxID=102232 RepID=UPI0011818968|nr:hypothetical protein [Gloeocapsa sp. PCC 73106]